MVHNMIMRRMEQRDIDQVWELEQKIFTMPWTKNAFEDAVQGEGKSYLNLFIVTEEENEIIGYCGLWGIAGEGQINNVAVKAEFRNQHIGKQMLEQLIELGKEQGLTMFTLEVRESNRPAIKLYHNLGFVDSGIRTGFYQQPKEDAIIMWRY